VETNWQVLFGEIAERIDVAGYQYLPDGFFYPHDQDDESRPRLEVDNMVEMIGYNSGLLMAWCRWADAANGWNRSGDSE